MSVSEGMSLRQAFFLFISRFANGFFWCVFDFFVISRNHRKTLNNHDLTDPVTMHQGDFHPQGSVPKEPQAT